MILLVIIKTQQHVMIFETTHTSMKLGKPKLQRTQSQIQETIEAKKTTINPSGKKRIMMK